MCSQMNSVDMGPYVDRRGVLSVWHSRQGVWIMIERSGVRFLLLAMCRSVKQTFHAILLLTTQQYLVPGGIKKAKM